MKVVIFNSGIGKRMGDFTRNNHKSMARLQNGETIFERQLRILSECGIRDFIVTTGPFEEQIKGIAGQNHFSHLNFTFVKNPVYDKTNYIYSMYLARDCFDDDALVLHGDLVFNRGLVEALLAARRPDIALVNKQKPLPEKDFKVRVANDRLREVSIHIFDADCFAFQPLYKLSRKSLDAWMKRVSDFINAGNNGVYAENALNEISGKLNIEMFSYEGHYIDEVDTLEDLKRVAGEIREFDFAEQRILDNPHDFLQIPHVLKEAGVSRPMLVCGKNSYSQLFISQYFDSLNIDFVRFSGFSPNPDYEEVAAGTALFKKGKCDFIISVGGGSAIDTAKNIKIFSMLDGTENYLKQTLKYSPVKHLAIPATAGTGSESTRFSVVYYNGQKQSVAHDAMLPDFVILEPRLLETLPDYQKKVTAMDALCQCIEAVWSVNSTPKCREYAQQGIQLINDNIAGYLNDPIRYGAAIMKAANLSGRAINISQTTAAHAMSYKMTSLYGVPHGHAVALCLLPLWKYMLDYQEAHPDELPQLKEAFDSLAVAFGVADGYLALLRFKNIFDFLKLDSPRIGDLSDIGVLVGSVNPERLNNNPVKLSQGVIKELYRTVFRLN